MHWTAAQGWQLDDTGATNLTIAAPLAAVARTSRNLDVFYVGNDGNVYTAFWWGDGTTWQQQAIVTGDLNSEAAPPGTYIAATARSWNNLDVFYTDGTNTIHQASWTRDQGWINSSTGLPSPQYALSAVTRTPYNLDLFYVDASWVVETDWWHLWNDGRGNAWNQYNTSPGLSFQPNHLVGASSSHSNEIDIFVDPGFADPSGKDAAMWLDGASSWSWFQN